jgi:hypothetical protein
LHLSAFIDRVRDFSKGGYSELRSWFIKLRCIEEVNKFGPELDRTVATGKAEGSPQRKVSNWQFRPSGTCSYSESVARKGVSAHNLSFKRSAFVTTDTSLAT